MSQSGVFQKGSWYACGSSFSIGQTWLFKNRGGQGLRSQHCWSWYGLLERDNRSQERVSDGANEDSVFFQPGTYLDNKILVSDIDGLKIFKLYEHPEIRPQIEVMKTEVMKYQTLVDSIKSFEERKDIKGKDTFDLSDWWKSNCVTLPGFAYVLCVVMTNSPNSCPPESLCSTFKCDLGWRSEEVSHRLLSIINTVTD